MNVVRLHDNINKCYSPDVDIFKPRQENIWKRSVLFLQKVSECRFLFIYEEHLCSCESLWTSCTAVGVAPYLVNTLWILQPGVVHLLHIVGARPVQERLRSYWCRVAPDWLKRPCTTRGGTCDWPLLADSLSRL